MLHHLYENGTTIIFSSHNLEQIDKLTKDIYFMIEKRLVPLLSLPDDVVEKEYEILTINATEFYQLVKEQFTKIEIVTQHKCTIQCSAKEMEQLMIEFKANILEYHEISASLEEIYFKLYEDYAYEATEI